MSVYVDTNVLVYWLVSDPVYGEKAMKLVESIEAGNTAITSALSLVQVNWVMESLFKAGVIKKHDPRRMIESIAGIQNLRIVRLESSICKRALRHVERYGFDFEDAVHLETALRHKCAEILSADRDFDRGPLPRRF